MILLLQIISGCLLLQLLFALWNTTRLPKLGVVKRAVHSISGPPLIQKGVPRLSVLIPARDEADNIAACLASVLACRSVGWDFEVLVLDDRSSDGTGELAAATGDHRVKVLAGRELPEGWLGKSNACVQLAEAASGTWLLFLDADIRLRPEALEAAILTATAQGGGLVTGFPWQVTRTWLEKLIVPLMNFTIICHLPIPLVRGSKDSRFVAAHGGFMLIHRDSYSRSGGHAGIRAELVDDMALARAVKISGDPVTLANVVDYTEMRMYHNAQEVWKGYRKNIYAGLGRRPLLLLGLLTVYTMLYVLPIVTLTFACLANQGTLTLWALLAALLGIAIKRTSDASAKQAVWLCLLVSVSMLGLIAIAISSWRGAKVGQGYEWKGRWYR
ncbi:glycosyltransferase family 2 protein [Paenibacillus monticola]|uniref:Glycosyltransferase n=1 Tax=Paenibacillus monticola TaxID=2666075 RepID=A0A7X2H6B3_9BACL|nr:glycosyltransferase family 2 protein [Paenibacillus monticola]MRN54225.1 glycosyltransferase [Paenibacillus monticola]